MKDLAISVALNTDSHDSSFNQAMAFRSTQVRKPERLACHRPPNLPVGVRPEALSVSRSYHGKILVTCVFRYGLNRIRKPTRERVDQVPARAACVRVTFESDMCPLTLRYSLSQNLNRKHQNTNDQLRDRSRKNAYLYIPSLVLTSAGLASPATI